MERILSEIPALRNLYKGNIPQDLLYASDTDLLKKAQETYDFWKKMEDPKHFYISKKNEPSSIVRLGKLENINACPFHNTTLIQKARETLVKVSFEDAKIAYDNRKPDKKKRNLIKLGRFIEIVFRMTDWDVFLNLEYYGYFVFERKESLSGLGEECQEILLKVEQIENN